MVCPAERAHAAQATRTCSSLLRIATWLPSHSSSCFNVSNSSLDMTGLPAGRGEATRIRDEPSVAGCHRRNRARPANAARGACLSRRRTAWPAGSPAPSRPASASSGRQSKKRRCCRPPPQRHAQPSRRLPPSWLLRRAPWQPPWQPGSRQAPAVWRVKTGTRVQRGPDTAFATASLQGQARAAGHPCMRVPPPGPRASPFCVALRSSLAVRQALLRQHTGRADGKGETPPRGVAGIHTDAFGARACIVAALPSPSSRALLQAAGSHQHVATARAPVAGRLTAQWRGWAPRSAVGDGGTYASGRADVTALDLTVLPRRSG
jgi:hypothetical protein